MTSATSSSQGQREIHNNNRTKFSMGLKVKILAVLNFVFWLLLLLLYGRIFFSVENNNGYKNNYYDSFKNALKKGGNKSTPADRIESEPVQTGGDSFVGNDFLYLRITENDTMVPYRFDLPTSKANVDEEVTFSAALLTSFAVVIVSHILLSFQLFYAAITENLLQCLIWFYFSSFLFGVNIVCQIVATVVSGFHIFLLCQLLVLVYFAFCLWLVFHFIQQLRVICAGCQRRDGGSRSGNGSSRNNKFKIPVLIVSPAVVQAPTLQIQNESCGYVEEKNKMTSERSIVASFPVQSTPDGNKHCLTVPVY